MHNKYSSSAILFSVTKLILYAGYIWLRVQHVIQIRTPRFSFGDTPDYLRIASEPLTSPSFWFASKPPLTPLFFKIWGSNFTYIAVAQLVISILAWGILALAFASIFRPIWLKLAAFAFILAFSLGQNIIMWDMLILGDSLALSVLALFLAAGLLLLKQWKLQYLVFLFIASLLLAFVRDTYAYFLLMVGGALLVILFFTQHRGRVLLVSGMFIGLFLASNTLSSGGLHWYTPFLNTIGMRILPNPEYMAFFEKQGLPVSPSLLERTGNPFQADGLAMLKDPNLAQFREWAQAHGKSAYFRFLWHYKADALQNPLQDTESLFNPDVYYYTATRFRPILPDTWLITELLYPTRFGILAFLLGNLLAAACVFPAIHYRQPLWLMPLILILSSYPQAVLIWNADPMDMARHSLYHNLELRLGIWMMAFMVADFLVAKYPSLISIQFFRKKEKILEAPANQPRIAS